MDIYTVKSGDSIYSIAQRFQIEASKISLANELPDPNRLVVGQALVVPINESYYTVRKGDTLWKIGRTLGVSYQSIAKANNLSITSPLTLGTQLLIPASPKTEAEFLGYVETSNRTISSETEKLIKKNAKYLTYLGPANFEVQRNGSIKEPPLKNFGTIAQENDAIFLMVLANIEDGGFSAEVGEAILNNADVQDKLLNNIIRIATEKNFKDIHFDFEFLRPEDKNAYIIFLEKAKKRLQAEDLLISVALAPKTSSDQKGKWYEAHDYKRIGEIANFVVPMTYEWGYSGGPPMAVSPIGPVRDVLEYAISEIPSKKIIMGQNLYGYDWTLPFKPGGEYAKAISVQRAIEIAYQYNASIQYDKKAQAPFFRYSDSAQKTHEVWFEDARSIQAKFDLLKELNLRGMAYWKLGLPFPQNWLLLDDNFKVIKRIPE
ncbi:MULTISPECIES: LysM peptidoglycan-binding domain-containing protein [Priestia]|uniref:Glycoside hydrolase family 18 protein n=1 Tax=Priestia flexa TaxID=86664 RepID=A0ABU4JAU0_9BACI|nr:glycoside hydrolase family 18 protein [Priestia flexa]MDW8518127.1 glycoside hydrolase family 18 protein [Priestia flexa]